MNTGNTQEPIFPLGEKAPAEYFTGSAWVKMLVANPPALNCTVGNVVFEPGCRNNWHSHAGGQILSVQRGMVISRKKGNQFSCCV